MENPINTIKSMMSNMTPEQMAMNIMQKNSNPVMKNLLSMAQKGDDKGIETFARNLYKERGLDFDKEFGDFMKQFKG